MQMKSSALAISHEVMLCQGLDKAEAHEKWMEAEAFV